MWILEYSKILKIFVGESLLNSQILRRFETQQLTEIFQRGWGHSTGKTTKEKAQIVVKSPIFKDIK